MFHGWQHLTPEDREVILRGIEDGTVYGGPFHLELDWVDKCNARCFFCNSAHTHGGQSIPWERAERFLNEAREGGLRSIRLSGGGEPTLHPNFPDLLRFLAKNKIILDNVNTNGTLLNDRVLEALAPVRVGEFRVSLNFSDPDAYAEGMGLPPRLFDRTIEMLQRLAQARRQGLEIEMLVIQFFVTRGTARTIRQSYALGRDLGADAIHFRELWGVDGSHYFTPDDLPEVIEQMAAIIREDWERGSVVSHLESHGIGPQIATIYDELRAELGGESPRAPQAENYEIRYCYIGWYSMTILGSQAVYPCCYLIPEPNIPTLGNLEQNTLGEIWRGPAYQKFRKEMRDYFILQRKLPLFEKRVGQITRACASHHDCPITRGMCDEAFYEEAERRLAALRARPGNKVWRFVNKAGRAIERNVFGKANA